MSDAQNVDVAINRQSILFLTELKRPSPDPQAIIRWCRRMGFGAVLFEFPRIWLGGWPDPPPYDVPAALWPGGRAQAVAYFEDIRLAGIRVGAQMPLHQPPGGHAELEAHVGAIAELCVSLGLTDLAYFDGAEKALAWGPLSRTVDEAVDMFLDKLPVRPQVIQSSVGRLCLHETRGGQTDYFWYSEQRIKEARRAIGNAAEYARQHGVAADGGWLTDTVPGGDGRLMPLSPIEVDTIWALALGHDVPLTFRTSEAGLRHGAYDDSVCWPMWMLEQARRIDGGGERWAYLRRPLLPDQWGWMCCPMANPPIIAAYEVPYPAQCCPRLHMFSGELGDDRVVMVWADGPMAIEFDLAHSCPGAQVRRVVNYRGRTVPHTRTSAGRDRLALDCERLWMVAGPAEQLTRYRLNTAMRFLEVEAE